VFARRGVRGTGLSHVADALGVGRSSLYHYYPDKRSLVRDLLSEMLAEEEALFDAVLLAEGPPHARLERFFHEQIAMFDAWRVTAPLLFELRSSGSRRLRPFFRRIRGKLAVLFREAQQRGEIDASVDPMLASASAIALIDGLLLQYFVEPGAFDRDALARTLVQGVQRVLAP
jgi:AcrR family transcriptional regulator